MASDRPVTEINGINLDNYYPTKRAYNSVAYVHKKFLNGAKDKCPAPLNSPQKVCNSQPKDKEYKKKTKKSTTKNKGHKSEQNAHTSVNNDRVVGQTIKFAKNIVPIVIPPSINDSSHVYYTINTTKKTRNQRRPKVSTASELHEMMKTASLIYKTQQEKKVIETYRKDDFKTESSSRDSTSRLSIENIAISRSLNSTISDVSEKRTRRTRPFDKKCDKTHIDPSESLEAFATDLLNTSGEAKIKIHLMDDTAKDLFYESIRKPVIEAIKESVAVIQSEENAYSKTVHKYVQCHTQKLDNIIEKLSCIAMKLDDTEKTKPKVRARSSLEEIGEDIEEENVYAMEGDITLVNSAADKQKSRNSSAVTKLNSLHNRIDVTPNNGRGEEIMHVAPISSERPNNIPARYCWTDSTNQ